MICTLYFVLCTLYFISKYKRMYIIEIILVLIVILIVAKALPYLKRKFTSFIRSVLYTNQSKYLLNFYITTIKFITSLFIHSAFSSHSKCYIQSIGTTMAGYKKVNQSTIIRSIITSLFWLVMLYYYFFFCWLLVRNFFCGEIIY